MLSLPQIVVLEQLLERFFLLVEMKRLRIDGAIEGHRQGLVFSFIILLNKQHLLPTLVGNSIKFPEPFSCSLGFIQYHIG
jgi:hypothetical protein